MITSIENKLGIISYDNALMDQIINEALSDFKSCYKLIRKEYTMHPEGLDIEFSVFLKFGTSISNFCNTFIDVILKRTEFNLELPVNRIDIRIEGIYSKKLVKRDIRFEYNAKTGITDNRD